MDARGLSTDMLIPGAERSSMDELTKLSIDAEKVFIF